MLWLAGAESLKRGPLPSAGKGTNCYGSATVKYRNSEQALDTYGSVTVMPCLLNLVIITLGLYVVSFISFF